MKDDTLTRFHHLMEARYGPTGWWPGETPFEIAVGAILVQNTAWTNTARAIANLKEARLLDPHLILDTPPQVLHQLVQPSGYFRVKTRRLQCFCRFLVDHYAGSMSQLAKIPLDVLRPQLLAIHGIGPETADDILLYACRKPVFVVDAYTRRILARHGLVDSQIPFHALQDFFHENLPADLRLFQEFHALLVLTAKDHCRRAPRCESCPLAPTLQPGQPIIHP